MNLDEEPGKAFAVVQCRNENQHLTRYSLPSNRAPVLSRLYLLRVSTGPYSPSTGPKKFYHPSIGQKSVVVE